MAVSSKDRDIIRDLARQYMEVAALPVHAQKRDLWRRLNGLKPARPMVWINELPWPEMQCDELKCVSEDKAAQRVESGLRNALYLWRHMPADMVVDPVLYSSYACADTGFGIDTKTTRSANEYGRGAHHFIPVMKTEADIDRIQTPKVTADWEATERNYQFLCDLVGGIVPVQKRGITHVWHAAWDILIQWWGIEELYTDMTDRPEFVHKGVRRMIECFMARYDQYAAQGLLSVGNNNHRVGSGGLGITDELPQKDYDGVHARPMDQWGSCTGQIFSEVSPAMHWEFCLQHEVRLLERFGLNCYGCCEPLHNKLGILRRIPRLRRISMSTWINVEKGAAEIGRDFIFSYKPNPAVFAVGRWDLETSRREIKSVLERTRGCTVELIMKDVTTCRNEPSRIWEWCKMAVETAAEYPY